MSLAEKISRLRAQNAAKVSEEDRLRRVKETREAAKKRKREFQVKRLERQAGKLFSPILKTVKSQWPDAKRGRISTASDIWSSESDQAYLEKSRGVSRLAWGEENYGGVEEGGHVIEVRLSFNNTADVRAGETKLGVIPMGDDNWREQIEDNIVEALESNMTYWSHTESYDFSN